MLSGNIDRINNIYRPGISNVIIKCFLGYWWVAWEWIVDALRFVNRAVDLRF